MFAWPHTWDLSSPTRDWTQASLLWKQSLTTGPREVPLLCSFENNSEKFEWQKGRYFTVISQGWARFYAPTEFLYPHPISWMIFLTELSSINELSLLQTWLCSGHVKGTLKDMVWTVESRISHEVNQVQLLAQESLPEEISSKCLELGAWGLGDLVLRHGRDLPQRWSWRFIFSCKI